jgi:hypothetical protein
MRVFVAHCRSSQKRGKNQATTRCPDPCFSSTLLICFKPSISPRKMHDRFCMLVVIFFKPSEIVCSSSSVSIAAFHDAPYHAAAIAMSTIAITRILPVLAARIGSTANRIASASGAGAGGTRRGPVGLGSNWDRCGVHYVEPIDTPLASTSASALTAICRAFHGLHILAHTSNGLLLRQRLRMHRRCLKT